ncbi:hypothetical protein [Altererythrobacter sp. GH1-8]|uniref:hypothetical protein n=1 Tax=Altererythrobacter sp. GH1-8 TaxID=3349333 RepID=UPI00374D4C59
MLLRRISQHLKEQNWFAVGIEIVIVLVGVFLGIQAANWNNEREQRQDERQILKRLSDETAVLLAAVKEEKRIFQNRTDLLTAVQPVIYSLEVARPLSDAECEAVALSHIYRLGSDELPVLNELIGTGRFDRLRSDELKQELRQYILFRDALRSSHAERTNEIYRLSNRHPDAISVTSVPRETDYAGDWTWLSGEGYRWKPSCDVQRMRSNQSFLNDFFDNSGRSGSVLMSYAEREAMLISLQEKLDALLKS